jgi:hypothetical protein
VLNGGFRSPQRERAIAITVGSVVLLTVGATVGWMVANGTGDRQIIAAPTTLPPATTTTELRDVGEFPSDADTGVLDGVVLKASGSIQLTQDGQVVENRDVTGSIIVSADNVVIRNVRVSGVVDEFAIRVEPGRRGVLIEDVEVAGVDSSCQVGVYGEGYTARRLDVHGCIDGFRIGSDTVIERSWVHDLLATDESHNDAVQSLGGVGIVLRNNRLEGFTDQGEASASVQLDGRVAPPLRDVLLERNFFSGGGYTLRIYNADGDVRVVDNVFDTTWTFGPAVANTPVDEWSRNVDTDGDVVELKQG